MPAEAPYVPPTPARWDTCDAYKAVVVVRWVSSSYLTQAYFQQPQQGRSLGDLVTEDCFGHELACGAMHRGSQHHNCNLQSIVVV